MAKIAPRLETVFCWKRDMLGFFATTTLLVRLSSGDGLLEFAYQRLVSVKNSPHSAPYSIFQFRIAIFLIGNIFLAIDGRSVVLRMQ